MVGSEEGMGTLTVEQEQRIKALEARASPLRMHWGGGKRYFHNDLEKRNNRERIAKILLDITKWSVRSFCLFALLQP